MADDVRCRCRIWSPGAAEEDGLGKRLREALSSSFTCRGIYLSDAGLLAHLRFPRERPEGEAPADVEPSEPDQQAARERLARLLRTAADCLAQLEVTAPVVALVEGHRATVLQWAGDQDWHRGDFAVVHPEQWGPEAEHPERLVDRFLSRFEIAMPDWHPLEPMAEGDYLREAREERKRRKLPERHDELVGTILRETGTSKPLGPELERWRRKLLESAHSALGGTA